MHWQRVAKEFNNELLAGLLYAPWIYSECVNSTDEELDSIFFLLSFDKQLVPTLYAYYQHYTSQESSSPVMAAISDLRTSFYFSIHAHNGLWDQEQWSCAYGEAEIPDEYLSEELHLLKSCIAKIKVQADLFLHQIGCRGLQ